MDLHRDTNIPAPYSTFSDTFSLLWSNIASAVVAIAFSAVVFHENIVFLNPAVVFLCLAVAVFLIATIVIFASYRRRVQLSAHIESIAMQNFAQIEELDLDAFESPGTKSAIDLVDEALAESAAKPD